MGKTGRKKGCGRTNEGKKYYFWGARRDSDNEDDSFGRKT